MNASMGGNTFPLEDLLSGGLPPTNNMNISVGENSANVNSVLLTVTGVESYIPVGQESLNKVPMQTGSTSQIEGSVTMSPPYTYDYLFDPPLDLSTLPQYEQIKQQTGTLLDGVTIESITATVTKIKVFGNFIAGNNNKADYTIQTEAPLSVVTNKGESFDLLINAYYFSKNPIIIQLDAFCTKQP
jgi:hypothetical protein